MLTKKKYIVFFQIAIVLIYAVASHAYHVNWCNTFNFHFTLSEYLFYDTANLFVLLIWPYLNYFFLIEIFLNKKHKWTFLPIQLGLFYFSLYASAWVDTIFMARYKLDWFLSDAHIYSRLFINLSFALLITALRFLMLLYEKQEKEKELRIAQMESDMRFLRAQINPHFLFNALNNIYSYAIQKKEETPELILKLSSILRHLAVQKDARSLHTIQDEIDLCKAYMDLFMVNKRWLSKVSVNINIEETAYKNYIEPQTLLTLIENAFKFTNLDANGGFIDIKITQEDTILCITVRNSIGTNKEANTGIGLSNLQKRLDITYAKDYQLNTGSNQSEFLVTLRLPVL